MLSLLSVLMQGLMGSLIWSLQLYFYRDQYIYEYNFGTAKERPILSTRESLSCFEHLLPSLTACCAGRRSSSVPSNVPGPRTLSYNSANKLQHCVLLYTDQDGSYELYVFPKDKESAGTGGGDKGESKGQEARAWDSEAMALRGYGKCAVWVSRNRFAVLDKQRQVRVRFAVPSAPGVLGIDLCPIACPLYSHRST